MGKFGREQPRVDDVALGAEPEVERLAGAVDRPAEMAPLAGRPHESGSRERP
jgi:hypothetical protein